MKRIMIMTILVIISLSISFADDMPKVYLNGEELTFKEETILLESEIMVPMREFFESLGTQVSWYQETRTVVGYKSNMFVKLNIDSKIAFKNGKSFTLDVPPALINSKTLVPAKFIAEAFDMEVIELDDNAINLVPNNDIPEYHIYDTIFYKMITLDQLGISLFIPSYWKPLDSTTHTYGLNDEYDNFKISISKVNLDDGLNLEDYIYDKHEDLNKLNNDNINFANLIRKSDGNIDYLLDEYDYVANGNTIYKTVYYYQLDDYVAIIEGTYYNEIDKDFVGKTFDNIAKTVAVNKETIQKDNEHYVEFPAFFNYNIVLNDEYYSNMEVNNQFLFSGSIGKDTESLTAIVRKDKERLEMSIDINENNTFSSDIYIPFGLGKHNVSIIAEFKENGVLASKTLLQYSVINTSSKKINYLIPTKYINSVNFELSSYAHLLTYTHLSDLSKANAVFDWLYREMNFLNDSDELQNSFEVYESKSGTALEINFLLTAMLRSIDIPTKIVKANDDEGNIIYWTEVNINGVWEIYDIASALLEKELEDNSNRKYIQIDRENFIKDLRNIGVLNH